MMQDNDSRLKFSPFSRLDLKVAPHPAGNVRKREDKPLGQARFDDQEDIFLEAMKDVAPIGENRKIVRRPNGNAIMEKPGQADQDAETVKKMISLILKGEGFSVADTPEYMEGTGYNVHPEITRRLHQGDFSVQANLDLHGLTAPEAREAFDGFIRKSIYSGKRNVLVIHGRGLSSPGEPVLKNRVKEWLTRSGWRKWVIAFASAATHDGGAGATYILLRNRPVSKKSDKPLVK